jgi:hypothetical protein
MEMHDSASFEIKALLTLALLKSGTSAKDIQTAVNVASAARLMVVEEYAELIRSEESGPDANVTNLYEARHGVAAGSPQSRKRGLEVDGMNSDIKALLSVLLLQHGASPKEILTTLRMAAAARAADDEEMSPEQMADEEDVRREPEKRHPTPKQTLRNELLAPIAKVARAA